jgi:hypothetical protein
MEGKTLEPSNPGTLEPDFPTKEVRKHEYRT